MGLNIETLLHIFATLPVATASGERSFKLIKTYLRSSIKEDRFDSLAHLYINKDINFDRDQVFDQFAKSNRRYFSKICSVILFKMLFDNRFLFVMIIASFKVCYFLFFVQCVLVNKLDFKYYYYCY